MEKEKKICIEINTGATGEKSANTKRTGMNICIGIDTESTVEKNPANINGTGKNICIGFNTDATRKKYR